MRNGGGSACQQGRPSPALPSAWASVLCGALPRGPLGQTLPQGEGRRLAGGQLGLLGSGLSRWGLDHSGPASARPSVSRLWLPLGPT